MKLNLCRITVYCELRFDSFRFLPPPLQVVFALFLLCLKVQSEGCEYRLALNADVYSKGCCVSHHRFWHQGSVAYAGVLASTWTASCISMLDSLACKPQFQSILLFSPFTHSCAGFGYIQEFAAKSVIFATPLLE